mgnify:CR=1 FL=1
MTNKNDLQKERREFLKASALVAGGVMMSGYSWAGVNSAVDDTIKIPIKTIKSYKIIKFYNYIQ